MIADVDQVRGRTADDATADLRGPVTSIVPRDWHTNSTADTTSTTPGCGMPRSTSYCEWAVTHNILATMIRVSRETKAATRARLLEAAAAEFASEGLDGANINRISLTAGLAKGTVYNYFVSKEDLFLAVVGEACERAAAGARAVPRTAPTERRLHALAESDVQWAREHEAFARVLVRQALSGDPRFHPQVLEAAAPFISAVAEVLADGVERGEIRDDIPVGELALVFTGLGKLTLVQHWGSSGAWPSLAEIPDLVVRLFLEGAGRSRPAGQDAEEPR